MCCIVWYGDIDYLLPSPDNLAVALFTFIESEHIWQFSISRLCLGLPWPWAAAAVAVGPQPVADIQIGWWFRVGVFEKKERDRPLKLTPLLSVFNSFPT